ncbi:MAG: hypothetical protein ACR2PT_20340 [Endozoicomonas sp.]
MSLTGRSESKKRLLLFHEGKLNGFLHPLRQNSSSLIGLNILFWDDSGRDFVRADGVHNLGRSWLENNGSENAAIVAVGSTDTANDEVDLKHLSVNITEMPATLSGQRGLAVYNPRGEIEHDYFF